MSVPVSGYLPLRYVLTDTLVVRTSFDPLRIDSEHVIGGRAQRGMLAAALRRAGLRREEREWVADGGRIRFATAHPRLEPGADPDLPGLSRALVAYPPPAHLYTLGKNSDTMADVFGDADPTVPYRAVRDPITLDRTLRARVRTTTERYLGRARIGDPDRGMPFFTTALDSGQVFEARWQLLASDRTALSELARRIAEVLADAEGTLTLGSGGTRAHGGVRVAPVDPDDPLRPDRADPVGPRAWAAGRPFDLLLSSAALVVGAQGQYAPGALVSEVPALLDRWLPGVGVEVVAAHVESTVIGAYHRGYHGPMAQRRAAAPGAVVRLRLDRDLPTELVRAIEADPLGDRVIDGHGQFVLVDPPPPGPLPHAPETVPLVGRPAGTVALTDGRTVAAWTSKEWDDPGLAALYDELLWNAAAGPVRDHARFLARRSARRLEPLTPSLVGRLREVVTHPHDDADAALEALANVVDGDRSPGGAHKGLHDRAVRALSRARVVSPGSAPIPVRGWLSGLSGGAAAVSWWEANRPRPAYGPAYAEAIAVVDLSVPEGLPSREDPSGLSERALEWERRTAARLCLTLVSSWLAEVARVLRARDVPHGGGGWR
ncbi:hypothetical protein PWG71_20250 [Nocardiopsis sp. N85]|uniref:hypothetical protein n=1 Tax=Nocardiopsis sp. N85 TaxID=3029400 RepID=UPI00237F4C4F|nr:hypothetical protein [Nocardiopsis sp. N85]MDE3723729.1 hypothetical protein [Nocardiopsis sp. N85]